MIVCDISLVLFGNICSSMVPCAVGAFCGLSEAVGPASGCEK